MTTARRRTLSVGKQRKESEHLKRLHRWRGEQEADRGGSNDSPEHVERLHRLLEPPPPSKPSEPDRLASRDEKASRDT
jgi:hypothetical protein